MEYSFDELLEVVAGLEDAKTYTQLALDALGRRWDTEPWFAIENAVEVTNDYLESYEKKLIELERMEQDAMNREYKRTVL